MTKKSSGGDAPIACPICKKSDKVIPIFHGPIKARHHEGIRRGKLKPGGCMILPDSSNHHCKRCDHDFADQEFKDLLKQIRSLASTNSQ